MRPATMEVLVRATYLPTPEAFAMVAKEAVDLLLSKLGVTTAKTTMLKGELDLSPDNQEFLEQLRTDLIGFGKAILTVDWGSGEDDWENIVLLAGIEGPQTVIYALWACQDAHEEIKRADAGPKVRFSETRP